MNKPLKILGIILLGSVLIGGILFFFFNKKSGKYSTAEANANYIIDNLNNEAVLKEFPENNFQDRNILIGIIGGLRQNCDWENRDGKFVDFYTNRDKAMNSIAFIYEYYLKCDSLRFVLIYNMDKDQPELFKMNIEPLETENKMIIFPEKQLKNR